MNNDQKKELIVKGFNTEEMQYEYTFYHYEDTQVQLIGTLDNWQNGGSGEMHYVAKGNGIVVNMRLADHMSYTLYQIKDKVEKNFTIHKHYTSLHPDFSYQPNNFYPTEIPCMPFLLLNLPFLRRYHSFLRLHALRMTASSIKAKLP